MKRKYRKGDRRARRRKKKCGLKETDSGKEGRREKWREKTYRGDKERKEEWRKIYVGVERENRNGEKGEDAPQGSDVRWREGEKEEELYGR